MFFEPPNPLEMDWSFPVDIFSAGMVLIEMFVGSAVFETYTDAEHMEMMEIFLGPMPVGLRRRVA